MKNEPNYGLLAGVCLAGVLAASSASAVTYTGSSGSLAASVDFSINGSGQLVVTLSNTSGSDALNNPDLLGAVFFDLAGNPALTPVSGVLNTGSHIFVGGVQQSDAVIGGEWAYGSSLSGAPLGAKQGISGVGFGLSYNSLFPGGPLPNDGGSPPDGPAYSLTSAGDNTSTGNGVMTTVGIIKSSVVFTLSGLPANFNLNTGIADVNFQYGTSLTDAPNVPGLPPQGGLPDGGSTVLLLGSALSGLGLIRRKLK